MIPTGARIGGPARPSGPHARIGAARAHGCAGRGRVTGVPASFGLAGHLAILGGLLATPLLVLVSFARLDDTVMACGRVEYAEWAPATAQVSARVLEVPCREGQFVTLGEPLLILDTVEARAERDGLRRRIDALRERMALSRRISTERDRERAVGLRCAREMGTAAEAEERLCADRYDMLAGLLERGAIGAHEAREAGRRHEIAQAQRRGREAEIAELEARHEREILEEEAARRTLQAEVDELELRLPAVERALADATVRAPISGFVLTRDPGALRGRRLERGDAPLALGAPDSLRLSLEVEEREVRRVRPGQEVRIVLEAYPSCVHRPLIGTVREVCAAPLPPETARSSVRYRVLVAFGAGAGSEGFDLRPGLGAEGRIVVARSVGLLSWLFRSLERRVPASATWR